MLLLLLKKKNVFNFRYLKDLRIIFSGLIDFGGLGIKNWKLVNLLL